ncbi:MAG: class I SAM-dependent methyltransferase [Chloroflexota bacterium]
MPKPTMTDQKYLLKQQYKDSSNLRARIQLHRQYSTNTYDWTRWVFDFLSLIPENAHLLEVGCGPCDLWLANLHRIPLEWEIVLSDMSPGMLEAAQNLLVDRAERFTFKEFDAQSIPFEDKTFDAVVANHMLYHLPDLDAGLSELRRVLKPQGRLFAATNGSRHMAELGELRAKFFQFRQAELGTRDAKGSDPTGSNSESSAMGFRLAFTMQNGEEVLGKYFSQVSLRRYEDALKITAVQPLFDYMMSSLRFFDFDDVAQRTLYSFLEEEMVASGGTIHIAKEAGLFQATR